MAEEKRKRFFRLEGWPTPDRRRIGAMTLQNRVTPYAAIVRHPARGALTGNRGVIHNERQEIVRPWANRRWICCRLEFKGLRRSVMSPGRWTELFFLDEATAFAAGHRPCAYCRRADFDRFKQAWLAGNPGAGLTPADSIEAIDRLLHEERTHPTGEGGIEFRAPFVALPPGTFVELSDRPGQPLLVWRGMLHQWSAWGYARPEPQGAGLTARLLTPPSTVNAFRAGYVPAVHASAGP